MRRDRHRTADPFAPAHRDVLSRLDVDTQVETRARTDDARKSTDDRTRALVCTTLFFFKEAVAANATNGCRLVVPTGATAFGSSLIGVRTAREGRVVRGYLYADAARSAGSCTLSVRVQDGSGANTDYPFTDCALDGATDPNGYARTQNTAQMLAWQDGIPYAAGDSLRALLVTDAGWLPTTANVAVLLVIAELEDV